MHASDRYLIEGTIADLRNEEMDAAGICEAVEAW